VPGVARGIKKLIFEKTNSKFLTHGFPQKKIDPIRSSRFGSYNLHIYIHPYIHPYKYIKMSKELYYLDNATCIWDM